MGTLAALGAAVAAASALIAVVVTLYTRSRPRRPVTISLEKGDTLVFTATLEPIGLTRRYRIVADDAMDLSMVKAITDQLRYRKLGAPQSFELRFPERAVQVREITAEQ